jgi:hypothetical protein
LTDYSRRIPRLLGVKPTFGYRQKSAVFVRERYGHEQDFQSKPEAPLRDLRRVKKPGAQIRGKGVYERFNVTGRIQPCVCRQLIP